MTSVFLFLILLFLLLFLIVTYKGDVAEPSVLFTAGFTLAVFNGLTNYNAWNFHLSLTTCSVISLGAIIFSSVCIGVKTFYNKYFIKDKENRPFSIPQQIILPNWVYIFGLAYTILSLFIVSRQIIALTMPYGGDGSLTRAIGLYDNITKFSTEGVAMHGIASFLYLTVNASTYIWLFLAIRSLVIHTLRADLFACINVLAAVPMTVISGGRNNLIQLGVAALAFWALFTRQNNRWQSINFSFRTLINFVIIALIALASFKPALSLLGRQAGDSTAYEYLSIYIGAPIKNLDDYLTQTMTPALSVTTTRWGDMTFASTRASFPMLFGNTILDWLRWQPFQYYGTKDLGNVYTTYYAFIFDWGIAGAMIAIAIMAFLSQLCYEVSVHSLKSSGTTIPLSVLLYGSVSYCCAFCFFSNRWVSTLINRTMLRSIVIWFILVLLLKFAKMRNNSTIRRIHA